MLPLIPELTDWLVGAKIFTKLDVRQAYYCVQMAPRYEFKMAFKICYGIFEYLLMPFGLTNALAQFQVHMQNIFNDLVDIFMVIYFDDILIFSKKFGRTSIIGMRGSPPTIAAWPLHQSIQVPISSELRRIFRDDCFWERIGDVPR